MQESTSMPEPLSWICSSFSPPVLAVTVIAVAFASRLFSIISLSALAGRWMICGQAGSVSAAHYILVICANLAGRDAVDHGLVEALDPPTGWRHTLLCRRGDARLGRIYGGLVLGRVHSRLRAQNPNRPSP